MMKTLMKYEIYLVFFENFEKEQLDEKNNPVKFNAEKFTLTSSSEYIILSYSVDRKCLQILLLPKQWRRERCYEQIFKNCSQNIFCSE